MSEYRYTIGQKVDALHRDLTGTALSRIKALADADCTDMHEYAKVIARVERAEKAMARAIQRMEKAVDSL